MPQIRFVIICKPRTGSNWLCSLLHSHPQILCHHEIFNKEAIYTAFGHEDCRLEHIGTLQERNRDPAGYLERLWREDFGRSAVGLKLLDCDVPELRAELLADKGVKKVLLRRRNRVRAFLSRVRARQTRRWHGASYDGVAVPVDAQELFDFALLYDGFYAGLREATASQPALEVVYEDLQRGPRETARLLAFLGVEGAELELQSEWVRQSRDSLRDAILNFDELAAALRGSGLEAELLEDASEQYSSQSAP